MFLWQDLQALVMAVNQEGRILGASDALAALLGYDGREFPGHFLTDLVDRSDAEETGKSVNRAFGTHEPVLFTTRFTVSGDRTVAIEWHGSSAMSTGVAATTLTVLGHDVTTLHQRISHLELFAKELHCVRKVNHLTCRERDPQRLIEKCCEILVSSGCLATCYILFIKDEELSGCAGFGEPAMVDALSEMVERREPPRCLSRMDE
ncbi:MAG: PAS domain-containing protein [Candidatus Xenobiia bacterium LiM19]